MAWAYIQSTGGNGVGGNTLAQAYASNVTAGSFLCAACLTNNGADTPTFSDNVNGNWVTDLTVQDATNGATIAIGHLNKAAGAGATTITADTGTGLHILTDIVIYEYSGVATSSPLDQSAFTAAVGGANMSSGTTAALFAPHELVFGVGDDDGGSGTLSAGAGFAHLTTSGHVYFAAEDEDSGAGTSGVASTFTSTVGAGGKNTLVVVYKLPSGVTDILMGQAVM